MTIDHRGVAADPVELGRDDERDVRRLAERGGEGLDDRLVGGMGHVGGEHERTVRARAEPCGQRS